ncbi:MAG: T9SS type A sorting domain-containing protein [Chitinophagaceae bacterium]
MKKRLPFFSLLSGALLLTNFSFSQKADQFAYAVTDVQQQGANWTFLRKIDLKTGAYSDVLLNGADASLLAYNAATKKQFEAPLNDVRFGTAVNAAFATGVAALAYDKKNDRLYYTPMFIDQLRYIDLKSMKVFYLTEQAFTGKPQKSPDQGNIVTRMVIASDGNGYAMTNDATQLIRFSTGKKLTVTDLGTVVDDQANKGVSIHNSCSSFGGDIIADDEGNLYVFSARNYVFKVNIESKVATHLGVIKGLPNGFTVNGAAINAENKIVVASALAASSFFTVDHTSLVATSYSIAGTIWQTSDMANSNLLATAARSSGTPIDLITDLPTENSGKVSIFPNPVTNNNFAVQFKELEAGPYTIQVTDVMGRNISQQIVNVGGKMQTQSIKMDPAAARGFYLVKIVDQNKKAVFSTKVLIQ